MLPYKDSCHVPYGWGFTTRGGTSNHKIREPGMRLLPDGVVALGRGFEPRLTDPELSSPLYNACPAQTVMRNRFALFIAVTAWNS
jgi:hypothetical protein